MVEIRLNNLSKQFDGETVIDALDLKVQRGELMALLGPSGCGKTTALKLISGLLTPDTGDILFNNSSVVDIPTEKRGAVLVFQDYLLFPHLTVAENIGFGLKMNGVSREIRERKVRELLELIDLPGYQQSYPHELSGGQKQRIALARALAINPRVMLLDEPLTNLDANLRGDMQQFIREIHLKEEMTSIFVTHDRDEAMLIADRIAVMNQGTIEQVGTPEQLYSRPETRFVSDFFGTANYIEGEISSGEFVFPEGRLPVSEDRVAGGVRINPGSRIKMMVRPEFIEIVRSRDRDIATDSLNIGGKIVRRKFVGERILYEVDEGQQIIKVTTLPPSNLSEGEQVYLQLDEDNIWLME